MSYFLHFAILTCICHFQILVSDSQGHANVIDHKINKFPSQIVQPQAVGPLGFGIDLLGQVKSKQDEVK